MLIDSLKLRLKKSKHESTYRSFWHFLHLDLWLFTFLFLLCTVGLIILYSASNQSIRMVEFQAMHMLLALSVMMVVAQIPPDTLRRSAPFIYVFALISLSIVLTIGHIGKGAQRWLNLGFMHYQPAEIMKIGIPLILAWYYHGSTLPIKSKSLLVALPIILIPAFLTAKQPDLSTAMLLFLTGISTLFLAGFSFYLIFVSLCAIFISMPLGWFWLHDYQKQRVITFLNPETDPLSSGYHIIQSKIAIGSGGLFGKGWLQGTQSNLHFLPERSTDFIFAVYSEEFGFMGNIILMSMYLIIAARGFYITVNAQDTFSRLLAGSITCMFFASFFINMGMVTGILPVVGLPLPLISYGGSSMVILLAGFGMLMSIQTHRKLVTT